MATPEPSPLTAPPLPNLPDAPPRGRPVPPPARPAPLTTAAPMAVEDVMHQLPAHRNKAERVTDHAKGLVDDVKEWVELRVELVRGEIEAIIDNRVGQMRGLLVFGVAAALTGLYALITLAIIIGALTGGRYWIGFLVINVILAAGTFWVKRTFAPGKMRVEHSKATGQLKISHEETPAQHEAKTEGKAEPKEGELNAK